MASWSSKPAPDLPDGLVLFDGVCALCSGWVQYLIARDARAHFRFVSIQSEVGRRLAERFGIDPDDPQSNLVVAARQAHFKSDSALAALSGLPGWGWVRLMRAVPKPLRDFVYDRVAKNRYDWFGRRETCLAPTPALAGRFIESEADLRASTHG